jgi:hypothetical protein
MDFTAQILNLSKRKLTLQTLSLFTIGSAIILGISLFVLTSKQGQTNIIQFAIRLITLQTFPARAIRKLIKGAQRFLLMGF